MYKTFGTANTRLSSHLLSYPEESISFIALHEATHQHIRTKKRYIPKIIQEAVCDVIGNYGTLEFFNKNKDLKTRNAKKQIKQIESTALEINKIVLTKNKEHVDYSSLNKKIKLLKIGENQFMIDRYDYKLNNAYLLRNRNYTLYYFKLKNLLMLMEDMTEFLEFICGLPTEKSTGLEAIDRKIASLKTQ